jgi:phosphoglycolate phosphatase
MKTAKNFGAGVAVGVSWGFRDVTELRENGADRIIHHPSELLGIIEELNK